MPRSLIRNHPRRPVAPQAPKRATPRIVVCMGVYNEAQYLGETIPAVRNQTMSDFQLFILDNGSTDTSWRILNDYAALDRRITLLRSPINLRCPDATNLGYHAAMQFWPDCKWFIGAGADDVMEPDYLESILGAADANPSANCIFSCMRFMNPGRTVWRYPKYDAAHVHENLYVPGWRAFTRELWEQNGPENTKIAGNGAGADWEWIARAGMRGLLRPYQLPEPKLNLRIRGDGRVTQSDAADKPALLAHMRAMVADYKREAMERVVWGAHAG